MLFLLKLLRIPSIRPPHIQRADTQHSSGEDKPVEVVISGPPERKVVTVSPYKGEEHYVPDRPKDEAEIHPFGFLLFRFVHWWHSQPDGIVSSTVAGPKAPALLDCFPREDLSQERLFIGRCRTGLTTALQGGAGSNGFRNKTWFAIRASTTALSSASAQPNNEHKCQAS